MGNRQNNALFSAGDAKAILNMRIPQNKTVDKMAWVYSTNGNYTVKTGYRMWQESLNNHVSDGNSLGCKRI